MSEQSSPTNAEDDDARCRAKVAAIFTELAGERAARLSATQPGTAASDVIGAALELEFGLERAYDIGFHLADWGADAAFLVALHLFPERFSPAEVQAGVDAFLCHAPSHTAAASVLYGRYPVENIFEVTSPEPGHAA